MAPMARTWRNSSDVPRNRQYRIELSTGSGAFHNQVPTAQVEVAHAEIHAFHPDIPDYAAKAVGELYVDMVIYFGNYLLARDNENGITL